MVVGLVSGTELCKLSGGPVYLALFFIISGSAKTYFKFTHASRSSVSFKLWQDYFPLFIIDRYNLSNY